MTSTVRLFADDMIAYLTIKSNRDCTNLQNDLDKLSMWEQKWKIAFRGGTDVDVPTEEPKCLVCLCCNNVYRGIPFNIRLYSDTQIFGFIIVPTFKMIWINSACGNKNGK
jgi:hypothetical protein